MNVTDKISAPTTVKVALDERSYDIVIGRNLLESAGARIAALRSGASVAIVTDETVASLHLATLERSLGGARIRYESCVVPAGESSKKFETLERVVDAVLAAKIERGDLVIALGGGVVGDLAGFAAAVARRGTDFVQIPTTLLSQVDSSVGGKTGINTKFGKNLVGAFHQPALVLADIGLLDTLPIREFRAGYAEVVKYGLISDAPFFERLERTREEIFSGGPARAEAIAISCRHKADIVGRDEREHGERALLNLGHTFGHALEAATGYSNRLLHGEGIAIGMVLAFRLSACLGLCDPADEARVAAHFNAAGLPTRLADVPGGLPPADELLNLMSQDKKVSRGALTFILARGIGRAFVQKDVDPEPVRALLQEALRG
ncbi:MAG TPA: 3-dehydroquinate synthase [Xanthobacteraceae bacterium]|nr:3-dehydroquinate synthase [Xanthobacteraceae bacterium]